MTRSCLVFVAACALAAPAVVRADSTHLRHLSCFKVRDPLPPATYKADQLLGEPGCVIRVPARLMCSLTTLTNVTPTPTGAGGPDVDLNVHVFLCYKEKCPKTNVSIPTIKDQFGTHAFAGAFVTGVKSKMLCSPGSPS